MRDLTEAQFRAALDRHGMKSEGFMGYIDIGIPGQHVAVSRLNGGTSRRSQLAYLLQQRDTWEEWESGMRAESQEKSR